MTKQLPPAWDAATRWPWPTCLRARPSIDKPAAFIEAFRVLTSGGRR